MKKKIKYIFLSNRSRTLFQCKPSFFRHILRSRIQTLNLFWGPQKFLGASEADKKKQPQLHHFLVVNKIGKTIIIVLFIKKQTKVYSNFLLIKSSRNDVIFLPVLYLVMSVMKAQKNLKNSKFENIRAGFLRRCQNSLRQSSPDIMHFQAWKKIL